VRVKVKDNVVKRRVRGTYGGNLCDYQGETAAFTADLTTVKLLLPGSVVHQFDPSLLQSSSEAPSPGRIFLSKMDVLFVKILIQRDL
jgi:hypothetical protein